MDECVQSVAVSCGCVGSRWCAVCEDTPRALEAAKIRAEVADIGAAVDAQYGPDHRGGVSFAQLPSIPRQWLCLECCSLCTPLDPDVCVTRCSQHGKDVDPKGLPGLMIAKGFVSETEEAELIHFLDNSHKSPAGFEGWKDSQGGRRKQPYGPAPNFKKRKVKVRPDDPGFPAAMKFLFDRVGSYLLDKPHLSLPVRPTKAPTEKDYVPVSGAPFRMAECSGLDYEPYTASNLDPHIDDTWLWGDRVVGLSLIGTTVMTFVSAGKEVCVVLEPRMLFVLSGEVRYNWMHGIRGQHTTTRRVSITIREMARDFVSNDTDRVTDAILAFASTFV